MANNISELVLYSASAGSGKTFTLVKEYLRYILSTSFRKVLAITFTNKATEEMKQRIIDYLYAFTLPNPEGGAAQMLELLIQETNLSQETIQKKSKTILTNILHNYSEFAISTIDSFFIKIVRSFAQELDLSINVGVNLDEKKLLQEAVEILFSKIDGDNPDSSITAIVEAFCLDSLQETGRWQVDDQIINFLMELIKESSYNQLQHIKNTANEMDYLQLQKQAASTLKNHIKEIQNIGIEIDNLLLNSGLNVSHFSNGTSGAMGFYTKLIDFPAKFEPKNLESSRLKKAIEEGAWYAKSASTITKSSIDSLHPQLVEAYHKAIHYIGDYGRILMLYKNAHNFALVKQMLVLIDELYEQQNRLNISEFKNIIATIVQEESIPFIYEKVGTKFDHFLIDEFQDTSFIQFANLLPLLQESLDKGKQNLIVGDPKQSIYRWRSGDVLQFLTLLQQKDTGGYTHLDSLHSFTSTKNLLQNYRSKWEVVHFNNLFFAYIGAQLQAPYASVYEANNVAQKYSTATNGGYIQLNALYVPPSEEDEQKENTQDITIENEPEENASPLVQATLKQLLTNIQEVIQHGYNYKDIAILVMTKREQTLAANYLVAHGINVAAGDSIRVADALQVQIIVAWLECCNQSNALVAMMMLLQYLVQQNLLSENLEFYLENLNKEKFKDYLETANLSSLYPENLKSYGVYELCELITYELYIKNNIEVETAVDYFLNTILEYSTLNNSTAIDNFLQYWYKQQDKKFIELPDTTQAVKITTVFKSKGLEYPIVLLPWLDWTPSKRMEREFWIDIPFDGKTYPTLVDKATIKNYDYLKEYENILTEEENKAFFDTINILYVAHTRAKDRLYLIGIHPDSYKKKQENRLIHWYIGFMENYTDTISPIHCVDKYRYCIGTPISIFQQKEQDTTTTNNAIPSIALSTTTWQYWKNRVKISAQNISSIGVKNYSQEQRKGTIIHLLMAMITTAKDIQFAVEQLVTKGTIQLLEKDYFMDLLTYFLTDIAIQHFFDATLKVYTEKVLIGKNNTTYRCDRMIIKPNETILIDFKTGRASEKHKEQLNNYAAIIQEAGYKNLKSYLIYLGLEKTVTVIEI